MKVKGVISEEKKHIRFADWSGHDVSYYKEYFHLKKVKIIEQTD